MRILIAEDEPSNLEEIERILLDANQNFELQSCLNPFDALSAFGSNRFDAALLDIQMPGLSGLTLAEQLRQKQSDLPVIFLTAHNTFATEAFELRATDYVLKPIRPERLLMAIDRIERPERHERRERRIEQAVLATVNPQIRVFGGLSLNAMGKDVQWDRVKTSELFAYLLMKKGVRVHKDELCDELWPNLDAQRALANLQVTMCRLRKTLSCFDRSDVCITFSNHYYMLTLGDIPYDLDLFDEWSGSADVQSLRKSIELYTGDCLEPEGWIWAETQRARYQKKYQHVVRELAGIHVKNDQLTQAESILRQAVSRFEPDDATASLFLNVAARLGGRSSLAEAYRLLLDRYDQTLAISPPASVQRTYQALTHAIIKA